MNEDDAAGDKVPSGGVPEIRSELAPTPHDTDVDGAALSSDASHVAYDPLPSSRDDVARRKRAFRHAQNLKTLPPWVKKIPWLISWPYMLMRRNDPNYEEHYAQWEATERSEYDGQEEQ
jgi:hypothetical protein